MGALASPTTLATSTLPNTRPTLSSSTSSSSSISFSTPPINPPPGVPPVSVSRASSLSSVPSQTTSSQTMTLSQIMSGSAIPVSFSPFPSEYPTPSPSSSPSNVSPTVVAICVAVAVAVSIVLIIIGFSIYKFRRRSQNSEAGPTCTSRNTPEPSGGELTPRPIRRSTGGLRDDWNEWIAKLPPMQAGLRRRDSAVLFGRSSGGNYSSEHLLTAHEVEASGILLDSSPDIQDPPPAYSPRRFWSRRW